MFYLSSSLISLLLYVQQSMSFPTQLPCRLVLQEKSVDLIEAAPGHATTICFQIQQKGLTWVSVCFRNLFS